MRFSHYRRPLFLLVLAWAACLTAARQAGGRHQPPAPALPAAKVRMEGRAAQYPVRGPAGSRFILDELSSGGPCGGLAVMVYVRDADGISYGDRVSVEGRLAEPFNYAVPGSLDWREYLRERGVCAEMRAESARVLRGAPFPFGAAGRLRRRTLEVFEKNFSPEHASVLAGMVLGEKRSVPAPLKKAFQDSGAMHLLVASGSNVGFVTFLTYFLCARCGVRKKFAGPAALACSGFYVLAAGLDPPLLRGYLMFSAGLAGYLLDRDSGVFQGLVLACAAILFCDGSALFDASFRMSFIASYGITVGMELWDGLLPFKGPARAAARAVMVSVFAQAGLYPLMALYFHRISLISVASNVALVPLSGAIMWLGFAALAASPQPLIFAAVKAATAFTLDVFLKTLGFFASFRFSSVPVSPPSPAATAAFLALALILLHAPLLGFRRLRLYALTAAACLPLILEAARPARALVSVFADRDTRSALVRGRRGGLLLFNPGIDGRKLADAVLFYGARRIDCVLVSTLDRKDWSGLAGLSGTIGIGKVVAPYGPAPDELAAALGVLSAAGTDVARAWPGESVSCGELEVRPGWPSFRGKGPRQPGYAGRGRHEGLDWEVTSPSFGLLVREGGRRISAGPRNGVKRDLESPPGKPAEMEL